MWNEAGKNEDWIFREKSVSELDVWFWVQSVWFYFCVSVDNFYRSYVVVVILTNCSLFYLRDGIRFCVLFGFKKICISVWEIRKNSCLWMTKPLVYVIFDYPTLEAVLNCIFTFYFLPRGKVLCASVWWCNKRVCHRHSGCVKFSYDYIVD